MLCIAELLYLGSELLPYRRRFDGDLEEVEFFEDEGVQAAREVVAVDQFSVGDALDEEFGVRGCESGEFSPYDLEESCCVWRDGLDIDGP